MSNPQFELLKSTANGQYYFRLKAGNGEIILRSEMYVQRQSAINGIASVKENAPFDVRYERKDNTGHYTFNLKAANGQIIGSSESYNTREARENGIASVKKNAPVAPVDDRT
ncbi:YegP family protein [Chitinophaga pendula]|uniref:YegP family protein n=1 Tax=Chitinophaga TaxID=79328 RepID=UPI000BAEE7C0|nr:MULTISPECIES: YegP family protein [Chitinophaga]ASZ11211.1 hypothetical protein CK934_09665 [Chitinophaga sp. MD30]UCJ05792.1 YegP family protein [Chitinophaga pendula]